MDAVSCCTLGATTGVREASEKGIYKSGDGCGGDPCPVGLDCPSLGKKKDLVGRKDRSE